MSKGVRIVRWVLVVLVAAMFLMAGLGKLGGSAEQMFVDWGYAPWFAIFIGVCEVLGGIGLLIPKTTRFAAAGLALIMLGAAYTNAANSEVPEALRPIAFLVVLGVVWWLSRRGRSQAPSQPNSVTSG